MNNEKINSKIKLSNNSYFVILIFVILKFRNPVVPNFDPHALNFFGDCLNNNEKIRIPYENSSILNFLIFFIKSSQLGLNLQFFF